MSNLGVYFGPKSISLVETKGKKFVKNIQIPLSRITTPDLQEKVPEEVKIVALFKDELRRNKIEASEVNITLSGKDLIIRTFDLPVLPAEELRNAVNFEVKKYIPFRVEDLIADYSSQTDKASHKNSVLFAGIKKEVLDKYTSIFTQAGMKITSLEYSGFSLLHMLNVVGVRERGVVAVVACDLAEQDEVNFIVLRNGFPLFSRDIILESDSSFEGPDVGKPGQSPLVEKLKAELRVSLDFYNRKFSNKAIDKIIFLSLPEYQQELENFVKEIGLSSKFVDIRKSVGKIPNFALSSFKAFGASLCKTVKSEINIDLYEVKSRARASKEGPALVGASLLADLKINPLSLVVGGLLCAGVFGYGVYTKLPIQNEINTAINSRPQTLTVKADVGYDELVNVNSQYQNKVKMLADLVNKQLYLTGVFDSLPRIVPDGLWLTKMSIQKTEDKVDLVFEGMAYLGDGDKEIQLVNGFLSSLKDNPAVNKFFKQMKIVSVDQKELDKLNITNFVISCQKTK